MRYKKMIAIFGIAVLLSVLDIMTTKALAGPETQQKWITISGWGVILPGETYNDIELPVPVCHQGKQFLIMGAYASPRVDIGSTDIDVVRLPKWAVSVPTYQWSRTGGIQTPLTLIGKGPEHISATTPAGQSTILQGDKLPVRIILLGGEVASQRFEFSVHITGACGTAFVAP